MAVQSKNPALQLSDRATSVQRLLGNHHRKIVSQFMKEQYEASVKEGDRVGILLSGGIDSGSMIFSLIEDCNKKIHDAYTAVIASDKPGEEFIPSSDYIRAKKICDYYGIKHHPVIIPRDPDYICNRMVELANRVHDRKPLSSRSDFEVMVLYYACIEEAAKNKNTVIFSGLLDGNIHMHSRKLSVPNKKEKTAFGHYTMMVNMMDSLTDISGQGESIMQKCKEHNISLYLSHCAIAAQYPYSYIPWKVINRPRDKWISILAYEEEYKKSTGNGYPYTMAMQCGDSGSREFFDEMVEKSKVSDQVVGKKVSTSKVFTNALAKISASHVKGSIEAEDDFLYLPDTEVSEETIQELEKVYQDAELSNYMVKIYGGASARDEWLAHLTSGGETPKTKMQINPKTGRSTLSYLKERKKKRKRDDPFNLSGPEVYDREKVHRDEDGKIDSRVDCFGSPLHRGPAFANTGCPRAQAGLCGFATTEKSEDKPEIHSCTVLDTWGSEVSRTIWEFPYSTPESQKNNHEWSASSIEVNLLIKSGFASFIKSQEKLF